MAKIVALVLGVLAISAIAFASLTTDPHFMTLVDGYQGVFNWDYVPGTKDPNVFPPGALASPPVPTSFNYVSKEDVTGWGNMDGITIQAWFAPRFLRPLPGWPWVQPVFYYGVDASNYMAFTWCNGTVSSTGTSNPYGANPFNCAGYLKVVVNGVPKQVLTEVIFSEQTYYFITLSLHPSDNTQSYFRVQMAAFPNYNVYTTNTFEYPVSTTWSSTAWPAGVRKFRLGFIPETDIQTAFGMTPQGSFSGKIDEVRVYNTFLAKQASVGATWATQDPVTPGSLVEYLHFDDETPFTSALTVKDTSGYSNDAAFAQGINNTYYHSLRYPNSQASVFSTTFFLGAPVVYNVDKTLPSTGLYAGAFYSARDYSVNGETTGLVGNIMTKPTTGKLCLTTLTAPIYNCSEWQAGTASNIVTSPYTFTYVPVRASCGKTETLQVTTNDGTEWGKPAVFNFNISALTPTFTPTTYYMNTTGGPLVIAGTGFGVDSPFVNSTESVTLSATIAALGSLNCAAPSVSGTGTVITCQVPAGVGIRNLDVKMCGANNQLPAAFQFYPPYVETAFGTLQTELVIHGVNFGPNRTFDGVNDFVRVNGNPCVATNVDHTEIRCTISGLTGSSTYNLSVSIGGQIFNTTFTFATCNPECQHGKCVSQDKCDCSLTGYYGVDCSIPLVCEPSCKNNGTCVASSDGSGQLTCNCPDGWTGKDCGTSSNKSNTAAIIGGVVGGGGGLILILGAAVIFLLVKRKNQRRGGKNFIPLEKKDFSKIIYGEQLTQQPEKSFGNPKAFEDFLIEDNLNLAVVISNLTQITEADKVAKAMIVVFQEHNKVLPLLEAFITEEVQNAETPNTLFRSNSMVSKMFKFYSRLLGLPYLYTTIGPEISQLIEQEHGLEVDPEKMEEGEDLDQMRWLLMAESQGILKQILKSSDDCPAQFRTLFAHIKQTVTPKFPANVNTTIGGFIFLRFFCPAVSSPEAYGIVEEPPSASARRLLILITKVLQNLSNDVEFGSKEPYMIKMNDFILSNRTKLVKFYEELVRQSTKSPATIDMPKHIKQLSIQVLMEHVRDNINKVEDAQLKARLEGMIN